MKREAIVDEARQWIGTPYDHQGRLKGVGCDCIGLIGGVALALAVPGALAWMNDMACHSYGRTPDARVLVSACYRYLHALQRQTAGLGDILVMRFETDPQHFAIISSLEPLRIIHAYAVARKVAENNIEAEWRAGITWRSLIVSAWQFRGVDS